MNIFFIFYYKITIFSDIWKIENWNNYGNKIGLVIYIET